MLIRTPKDLGILIRSTRKAAGWSQGELARQVGTTQKWISFVENGRPSAQLDMVLRTLAILRISLDARLPAGADETPSLIDLVADQRGRYGPR
jgi:y4mF family transcriptional regulator